MALGGLWHVGIVVDDLDAAQREFAVTPGLRFTSTLDREVQVRTECGVESGRVRWAATRGEQPDLEVIEQADGFWSRERNNGAALHHLAYWSDDLDADVTAYAAAGHRLEASGHDEDGRVRFVYLVSPSGVRIELGARYTEQSWNEWVGGGDYALQF
jgi:catechol 2,3-dioxygenase-like lactoylglutathione lyase family enzyme